MNKDEVKKMLIVCIDPICDQDDCNKQCKYSDYVCCQDYLCRDALAVIEEQEREIERYKDRIKHLSPCDYKEEVKNIGFTCKYEREIEQSEAKVKRAKLNVLTELKDRLYSEPNGWAYIIYIDEIIKDLENEK